MTSFTSSAGGNNAFTGISSLGGTANGPQLLYADPTLPLEATTKQYVDNKTLNIQSASIVSGVFDAARTPAFIGDISKPQGSNVITLANSGVIPGTYTKITINNKGLVEAGANLIAADIPDLDWSKITTGKPTTLAGYGITDAVSINGGTVTGPIIINGTPTAANHVVTKGYIDSYVSGSSSIQTGVTIAYPIDTSVSGFLRCNGAELDRTTYADLYAVVGDTFSYDTTPGNGKPWVQQYQTNNVQSADITGWSNGTSLPSILSGAQAVVTKNRIYLIGGVNSSGRTPVVYTTTINADGTIGTWDNSANIPEAMAYSQAVVTKNRIYLIGGVNSATYSATVYTCPINSDGSLGTWITGPSIPVATSEASAIVTKNRVYLLGGITATGTSSAVYTAIINADGTLGTWATDVSLQNPTRSSSAIVTKSRVYLLGGRDAAVYSSSVVTAPINTDGTIGTWTAGTSLPGSLAESNAIVTKNRVYLLGGSPNGSANAVVYTAPINTDGTLGTWAAGTSLAGVTTMSQAIVTNSRVYVFGSVNLAYINVANFSGGSNDYSQYYDGTDVVTDPNNFRLPNYSTTDGIGHYTFIKT